MRIQKIEICNFYSIEHIKIDFEKFNNLVRLEGINKDSGGSNGAGKSSVLEAVYWALTGKTIRKSNDAALVNAQAGSKTQVTLLFNGNYKIVRGRKPTHLEFYCGEENYTKASVTETQAFIDSYLNINHKVLLMSMFFGQHNNVNFIDATPEDKRSIIKYFLNLDSIFALRDRAKELKNGAINNMKIEDTLQKDYLRSKKEIEDKISKIKVPEGKFEKFSGIEISFEDVRRQEEINYEANFVLSKAEKDVESIEYKLLALRKNYEEGNHLNCDRECPTCGTKIIIDKDKLIEKHVKEEKTLILEVERITKVIQDQKKRIKLIPVSSKEYGEYLTYSSLRREELAFNGMLESVQNNIDDSVKRRNEAQKLSEIMKFWEIAFSEQGMIKYVIKNILSYFNTRCNYYLSYLTANKFAVTFDDELSETIFSNGQNLQYISLSGGEKRKLNLAVCLGLKDLLLLTTKEQSNIIFFDEIAENVDNEGLEGLSALLNEIKKDKKVFVVTHNGYLKSLLDGAQRLTIVKEKGLSRIAKS